MDVVSLFALDRVGFALAALAYLFFFLLTLATRVKNLPRLLLLLLSLVSASWAAYYALSNALPFSGNLSVGFEIGRSAALILFLLSALDKSELTWQIFVRKHYVIAISAALFAWAVVGSSNILPLHLLFTGSLLIFIFQLALLEAMYRKAGENKWQYKPLVLSFTICTLFDFVLLAESALFGRIDDQIWFARGFVYAAMVPLLILSVRRIQAWGINVYISRDIVLQSSLVVAAGVYLCLLAIAGFYIRYVGGNWSTLLQTTFIGIGFATLATLIFSGALRRKMKVFIEKHFFANKFDYREKWLQLTQHLRQLDISKADQHLLVLQAWLNAIGYSRGCLVQLTPHDQIKLLAKHNRNTLTTDEVRLINRYSEIYRQQFWLVDLSDVEDDFVTAQADLKNIDSHFIVPIHSDGELWGVCLMNTPIVDRLKLNWELRDYLMLVTEQIASYLMLMQASQTLSENAQFAAFSRMSAFVVHDLKNVKAQIDLILSNSVKHRHNPEFIDDSFDTLAAMQSRLNHMLNQLTSKRSNAEEQSVFSAAALIQNIITERCAAKQPLPLLKVVTDGQLSLDKERFASVIYHLIDNAQHATPADGTIVVKLHAQDKNLQINISDTGCGMSESFIKQRLFKPFDTTKGNSGMGIGAYDALHFAEQHNGQLKVTSQEGVGTTFTLILPLHCHLL